MRFSQVTSKDDTPTRSGHKSRGDRVVCMCTQLNRCVVCVSVMQCGQYGEVSVFALTWCKYDLRKGDLFVLSWTRLRQVCRGVFLLWCLWALMMCVVVYCFVVLRL